MRSLADRWRSVPAAAAFLALALLLTGLGVIYQNERAYQAQKLSETRVQADILAASVTAAIDFSDVAAAQESVNALKVNRQIRSAAVYDQQGRLFAGFERSGAKLPATAAAIGGDDAELIAATVPILRDGDRLGSVRLTATREPLSRRLTRYTMIALFVVMAALVAGVLGIAHAALRRVNRELALRAEALGEANDALQVQMEERAKAEEQLRQAQKMQALGQLTGGIAHDFNNMLTVIQGSADILQRPGLAEEKRSRFAAAISQTATRAAVLTSQLLAFARRQPLQPATVDLNQKVIAMAELLDRSLGERVRIETELSDAICAIKVDPTQLEAAILNVAVNARDAMPDGGTLTIRTGLDDGESRRVALSLSDTGAGIDPEVLERVFEPFFTTKSVGKGTGLGLSQVYGFTAQSEGEVRIDSAPGRGTTVTLLLPCSDEPSAVPAPSGQAKPGVCPGDSFRILVVDDNEEVGAFAQALLVELGHQVVRAASGAEALERFDEDEIDLVFTDIVMPGMDGLELADRLRARAPGLPIILATGFSEQIAGSAERKLPVLFKPYKPEALAAAVDQAMAERG